MKTLPAVAVAFPRLAVACRIKRVTTALLAGLSFAAAEPALAAGYTQAAIPTRIDVVRNDGFMVFGTFGNPGSCSSANAFFIRIDHPQYKQLYALALGAYIGKQKIYGYVDVCQPHDWYAVPTTTFNVISSSSALSILD